MEAAGQLLQARRNMRQKVISAFREVRSNESPDVVVASPHLNSRFLRICRDKSVDWPDEKINRTLLNARKAGLLKGLKSTPMRVQNQDQYRFASEIAVRFLERRDRIPLDQILCDPLIAAEFDTIAGEIEPGFSVFEYRWAALGLRKKRKLMPELV